MTVHAEYEDFAAIARVEDHGDYVGRHRIADIGNWRWGSTTIPCRCGSAQCRIPVFRINTVVNR